MTEETRYQITAEALTRLEADLARLEQEGRREMAARIKTAREWGDLKENSEYHDAKNDQAHLETKILQLRDRVNNAVVVEAGAGGDRAALGAKVVVRDEDTQKESSFELVSATEADPAQGRLSIDSPLGRLLNGAAADDVLELDAPRGARRLRVLNVG